MTVTVPTERSEQSHAHFKLQPFWSENPGFWFVKVECVLAKRNASREFNKSCLVVEALPHDSLCDADLIEQVLNVDPTQR
jgi:hypothetical protein